MDVEGHGIPDSPSETTPLERRKSEGNRTRFEFQLQKVTYRYEGHAKRWKLSCRREK
ncbi:hypothetical protein ZOD2009_00785 [Haladaptatus paucihalophilus DX253]|uniref:Uncharacterized protein n=1 Tax=Haladaptatus paucihalophilus DX253 TaxID=797209 RepID=E7QNY1_HALPU|nr:hypothetical protein ZOD2009_00785 [Haladaptatus paucihalophilus DX253]